MSDKQDTLEDMISALQCIIEGGIPSPIENLSGDAVQVRMAKVCNELILEYTEAYAFILELAQGNLTVQSPRGNQMAGPFKTLQANLTHLTWQTQQIAAGDLSQQVDFMGDFSIAFNRLIQALREKKKLEEELQFMSMHDALTGLYNRAYFNEELQRLSRGREFPFSILMTDLDGLKTVNDTYGHEAGDRLICNAAAILNKAMRGNDIIARIGGDEFAILLPGTDETVADEICARLRAEEQAFNAQNEPSTYISAGSATAHNVDEIPETMRLADELMYKQKTWRKAICSSFYRGACTNIV